LITKKQKLWSLYAQGYGTNSPEAKAVASVYQTRWDAYKLWEKAGMPSRIGHEAEAVARVDTPEVIEGETPDTAEEGADTPQEEPDTAHEMSDTAHEKADTALEKTHTAEEIADTTTEKIDTMREVEAIARVDTVEG